MKLADWLNLPNKDGTKKRRIKFASDIGVTPTMITEYCNGSIWPGKDRMREIERVTEGAVTANDFVHLQPAEPAQ